MKNLLLASAAGLCGSVAFAGGIDQSGQPITLIFQDGNYAEIGFGNWMPHLVGSTAGGLSSGNVYGNIPDVSLGVKQDINNKWSAALLVDQPWGANVDYPDGAFPFAGTYAEVKTVGITGLVRYKVDENFSLGGGLRATDFGASVGFDGSAFGPLSGYTWDGDRDWGFGYVLGAAYEIPDIALRVALTYSSETKHELDSHETFPTLPGVPASFDSTTEVTMPQSVNLDFQTGVTPTTLVYGSVRWVNWKDWTVAPEGLELVTGQPLVRFDKDAFTYRIGIGRQLTDAVSGAFEISRETSKGDDMGALDPYDGYTAIAVGGTYTMASGIDLTAGVSYSFLGDATAVENGVEASFDGNHAVTAAFRIGYHF